MGFLHYVDCSNIIFFTVKKMFAPLSFLMFSRLDESLSLKNLGISDVSLATLASEGQGTSVS